MRVTVVCSGNICRSPMAEVVLRAAFARAGLGDVVTVDSAGTGDWHLGDPADPRAVTALRHRRYDGSAHRAQQFTADWWSPDRHLVLAADRGHLRRLRAIAPADADVRLLRSFDPALAGLDEHDPESDVPDPYYDGSFDRVLDMVEAAVPGVVEYVEDALDA